MPVRVTLSHSTLRLRQHSNFAYMILKYDGLVFYSGSSHYILLSLFVVVVVEDDDDDDEDNDDGR